MRRWGVYIPVGAEEFPGPTALRDQLRRCSCGHITFLSLPCRNCGAQKSKPAFRWASRKVWTRRIGRWAFAAVYLLLAGYVALRIWVPLAVLIAVVTVGALAANLIHGTSEGDICYWIFHDSTRERKKLADTAGAEALSDAYDDDLRRLERMMDPGPSPECAEQVLYMAQDMAGIFHNRRVSALMASCLAVLPLSEGICVDLDQVCAWLEPEDVSDELLSKLGQCARLTCLPAGEPTARFVGRFCAFRVQEMVEGNPLLYHYSINHIPHLSGVGKLSLRKAVKSKKERDSLSALWNLAAVYLTPQALRSAEPPNTPQDMMMDEMPEGTAYIADAWFRYAWGYPTTTAFREMEALFSDSLGQYLKENWGRSSTNYADEIRP